MAFYVFQRKQGIGKVPDKLFRKGQLWSKTVVRTSSFDCHNLQKNSVRELIIIRQFQNDNCVTWMVIGGSHNGGLFSEVDRAFDFDKFMLSGVLKTRCSSH